jgi:hypothetical protein
MDITLFITLKMGEKSRKERSKERKKVTLEFGEYWRRNFIPPNSGRYKPIPLKESRPRRSGLASKELEILGHQIIFALPCCFFLSVVTPPDLEHLDSVPPGDPVCSLRNLCWLLYVGQVFLEL